MTNPPNEPTPETKVLTIQAQVCEPCLKGIGKECHTPGCAMFLHRVDLPLNEGLYEVIDPDELERERDALKAECAKMREAMNEAAALATAWVGYYSRQYNGGTPHEKHVAILARINASVESNAGADLLAKAQSAARLAEALRKIAVPKLGGKEQQYIAQAALREFEQTTISPNQQNT